jgi:hypothetical protein
MEINPRKYATYTAHTNVDHPYSRVARNLIVVHCRFHIFGYSFYCPALFWWKESRVFVFYTDVAVMG